MFGKVSPLDNYVVTEEDALEFVFQFQSSGEQPKELLHLLSERTLLIIGCSFPTWFVRFFLRLSRGRRLYGTEADKRAFIVDSGAAGDAGLVQFLNAFQTRTEVFTQYSAEKFVEQLATKWNKRRPAIDPSVTPEAAVFVSYASEDRSSYRPRRWYRAAATREMASRTGIATTGATAPTGKAIFGG